MDMLGGDESLFTNPGVLEQDYLPRLLMYRETQHQYIAECIKPLFQGRNGNNLLISGPSGIGKTACVKFVFRKLVEEAENVLPVYVNCWKTDTTAKIVAEIAKGLDIRYTEGKTADEVFDLVIKKLGKYSGVVFALDEFDKVQDQRFLYRILEDVPLKTVLIVSNNTDWVGGLDQRIKSRLSLERLNFKPYSYEETRGILRERSRYAFPEGVLDYEANETIVKKTFGVGDLRFGLALLKKAGEAAEARASRKIEAVDVQAALGRLKDLYEARPKGLF